MLRGSSYGTLQFLKHGELRITSFLKKASKQQETGVGVGKRHKKINDKNEVNTIQGQKLFKDRKCSFHEGEREF